MSRRVPFFAFAAPLLLVALLVTPARAQITVTPYQSGTCVAPGGQVTLGGTATAGSGLLNPLVRICCPPDDTLGTATVTETGGAPSLSSCSPVTACAYVSSPTAPSNGLGEQCSGTGTWPQGATETLRIPLLAATNATPGSTFSCKLDFLSGSSGPSGTQFLVLAVDPTCNTPPPPPPISKKVLTFTTTPPYIQIGTSANLAKGEFVCFEFDYDVDPRRYDSLSDYLPPDFEPSPIVLTSASGLGCTWRPSSFAEPQLLTCESSAGLSKGRVIVCGRFAVGHSGIQNVAYVSGPEASRVGSNPVPIVVGSATGTPPTVTPSGPTNATAGAAATFTAQQSRDSVSGAASSTTFAWLASDVDTAPAATGVTFTKTFAAPGQYHVTALATVSGFTAASDLTVNVAAAAAGCTADANTLCLGANGRFKVQVDWQDLPNQNNGQGSAHPITADTGAFWFFDPSNLELVVKVLDGTALNQHFWVFYGALSNVQYEIKVTDTVTGAVRTYTNPQGTQASGSDTSAFPSGPAADRGWSAVVRPVRSDDLAATPSPLIACTTGGNNLCLDGRFLVNVAWSDVPNHQSGSGTAVSLTSTTGYDWFFADTNIELIMKIVDGRALNGHFWFFYGALSNVQYTITVTDTQTGDWKTYNNPQGTQASRADTSAF